MVLSLIMTMICCPYLTFVGFVVVPRDGAITVGAMVAGVWAVVCVQVKYRAFNVRMLFITVAPVQRSPRQRPQ